jgi:hypothetical protein
MVCKDAYVTVNTGVRSQTGIGIDGEGVKRSTYLKNIIFMKELFINEFVASNLCSYDLHTSTKFLFLILEIYYRSWS